MCSTDKQGLGGCVDLTSRFLDEHELFDTFEPPPHYEVSVRCDGDSTAMLHNSQTTQRLNRFARGKIASERRRSCKPAAFPNKAPSPPRCGKSRAHSRGWREKSVAAMQACGEAVREYWKPTVRADRVGHESTKSGPQWSNGIHRISQAASC